VEDKQAITMFLSATNDGTLLPMQIIYKGLSLVPTPSADSPSYAEAAAAGFLFKYSNMKTYWSTQETMHHFVDCILALYFEEQRTATRLMLNLAN
jgi:hypothetical protein